MIGTWRQRQAREKLQDHLIDSQGTVTVEAAQAIDAAIEVATTVKITQDAIDALGTYAADGPGTLHDGAVAFLQALGFEVVQ